MYFIIDGINVNNSAQVACFTIDVTRIGEPPTNYWRISFCSNADVICPDITYNQAHLPQLNQSITYVMSGHTAGYCKQIGSTMNAKVEYYDGLNWITDTETSAPYEIDVNRTGIYVAIAAGFFLLTSLASTAKSKITRR